MSSPKIVSMIAALTDHRDLNLLEASLLKTVADLFAPDWAVIFHVGEDDVPQFSTSLRDGVISQTDSPHAFSELVGSIGVTSFPIMSRARKVLGYLLVQRSPALSIDEQSLMADLFRVYDNYLGVLRDSQIDRLTGLLNRRTFDEQLDRALCAIRRTYRESADERLKRRVGEGNGCFFMGEIDIDHFKSINDRFGHLHGDEVLVLLARILQNSFRKTDLIYRFGGEEFVVIVYVDDLNDAELSFERLRRAIENHAFPQVGKVTVSIGVAEIRDTSIPVELLGRADQALYYAKTHDRNQVAFYEALVTAGQIEPYRHADHA
ncbi:MAG: GGDEF domain-containing protein [Sulfuritalea sp.]|nr:GGDEF domain-containing protein [Sulfuritalea sp.]